jgi:uncharacterized damage-inducible protein DinB
MTGQTFASLDIVPFWSRTNDSIVQLVDYIPDDKLNWSPKRELWNFKSMLIHLIAVRHAWLENDVKDGARSPDVMREAQTKDGIKRHIALSWERMARFLSAPEKLAATYVGMHPDDDKGCNGHWIAYHLLEHDIHHRADILNYLTLLGIEHPEGGTP